MRKCKGLFIWCKHCHNAPCSILLQLWWLLTYSLYYLGRRHKELLKKLHKVFQVISRIKLILFFMAKMYDFFKTRIQAFAFSVINQTWSPNPQVQGKNTALSQHNLSFWYGESVELVNANPRQILLCQWDGTVKQLKEPVLEDLSA